MYKRVLVMLALLLTIATLTAKGSNKQEKRIVVGSKNYTEQYLLGEMNALLLEGNGFKVERKLGLSSFAAHSALEQKQIDLYIDYTGTAWATWMKKKEKSPPGAELYNQVKEADIKNGIVWLPMFPFENTYAMAVKSDFGKQNNLNSLEDLARMVKASDELLFAVDNEFFDRPDGFFGMAAAYQMEIPRKQVKAMENGLTYLALNNDDVNVAMVYSTDGRLKKYNLKVLDDNRSFFPPYNGTVLVHKDTLDKYPELEQIFAPLNSYLDTETMIGLNFQVDAEKKETVDVARAFLQSKNLIQ